MSILGNIRKILGMFDKPERARIVSALRESVKACKASGKVGAMTADEVCTLLWAIVVEKALKMSDQRVAKGLLLISQEI